MRDRRRLTVPLNVVLGYNLTGVHWPYLVPSTDNEEANGAEDLGVIKVPTLVCEADLYSCVVFSDRSVLPITNDLVTFHIPDRNIHTVHLSSRYRSQSLNLCSSMTKPADATTEIVS